MTNVADSIDRGFAITIDYGFTVDRLYAPGRMKGTLMCYTRHTAHDNPLIGVGRQDITAHVNFSSLMSAGEMRGLHTAGLTNQAFFLICLGLPEFASAPPPPDFTPQQVFNRNFAFKKLINPDGLGRYGVLVQYKGFDAPPPITGLRMMP
jgi:SAM-dependent MidA family methyltransferase